MNIKHMFLAVVIALAAVVPNPYRAGEDTEALAGYDVLEEMQDASPEPMTHLEGTIISERRGVTGIVPSDVLVNAGGVIFMNAEVDGQVLITEDAAGVYTMFFNTQAERVVTRASGILRISGSNLGAVVIYSYPPKELYFKDGPWRFYTISHVNVYAYDNAPKTVYITGESGIVTLRGEYSHVVVKNSASVLIEGTVDRLTVLGKNAQVTVRYNAVVQAIEFLADGFGLSVHDGEVDFVIAEGNYGRIYGYEDIHEVWLIGDNIEVDFPTEENETEIEMPIIPTPAPQPEQPDPKPEPDPGEPIDEISVEADDSYESITAIIIESPYPITAKRNTGEAPHNLRINAPIMDSTDHARKTELRTGGVTRVQNGPPRILLPYSSMIFYYLNFNHTPGWD